MKRWICLFLTLLFLSGCGAPPEAAEPGTTEPPTVTAVDPSLPAVEAIPGQPSLEICVEEWNKEAAQELVVLWEWLNPGCEAHLVTIPRDREEAESFCQNLRTQLLAGKGPDVFLCSTHVESVDPQIPVLFQNPEKNMHAGMFLPLDEYMARAKYMDVGTMNTAIMAAGQTAEGQVVLPLGYDFYIYGVDTDVVAQGAAPTSFAAWMSPENEEFRERVGRIKLSGVCGPIADYGEGRLLLTEEALTDIALQLDTVKAGDFDAPLLSATAGTLTNAVDIGPVNRGCTLLAPPNTSGGVTAVITAFAAINRNTAQPENAFSFLDTLLSPKVLTGEGYRYGKMERGDGEFIDLCHGRNVMPAMAANCILEGLSIYREGNRCLNYDWLLPERKADLSTLDSRINCVRFGSEVEGILWRLWFDCQESRWSREWTELDTVSRVSEAYAKIEMILAE